MAEHPWELTLSQFIEQVRRDYGIELKTVKAGNHERFLMQGSRVCTLTGIGDDDILTQSVLRTLCKYFDIPPLDFALDPQEED